MGGNAAIGTQDIVHIDLAYPLFRFLLEGQGVRGKIRIFVSEHLIRDLAGEQHAYIARLMNGPADQVHADARPDRRNIVRS